MACEQQTTNYSCLPRCHMTNRSTKDIQDTMITHSFKYLVASRRTSIQSHKTSHLHLHSHMRASRLLFTKQNQKKSLYSYPNNSPIQQLRGPSTAQLYTIIDTPTLTLQLTRHDRYDRHTLPKLLQPQSPHPQVVNPYTHQTHSHTFRASFDNRIAPSTPTVHRSDHRKWQYLRRTTVRPLLKIAQL